MTAIFNNVLFRILYKYLFVDHFHKNTKLFFDSEKNIINKLLLSGRGVGGGEVERRIKKNIVDGGSKIDGLVEANFTFVREVDNLNTDILTL